MTTFGLVLLVLLLTVVKDVAVHEGSERAIQEMEQRQQERLEKAEEEASE